MIKDQSAKKTKGRFIRLGEAKRTQFTLLAGILMIFMLVPQPLQAQTAGTQWADSVYKTLTKDQRIAQLMVVRLSGIDAKTRKPVFYEKQVMDLVNKYNVGGICLFQGGPIQQATIINQLQNTAKTPLLVCIDAEWGVGMRFDSVAPLPKQMMLGAMSNAGIVYKYGELVADQCKRVGIQVNYAPVVDINNNPNNPVINDRSFGEDKYKVADFGIAYMKGMQDKGVMACAKHFPGHGDVSVDSHLDLPVINKPFEKLDSLELFPFKKIFAAGVGSVMIAHLYIPAIDTTANRATSLSPQNIKGLLRTTLGYQGLTFTDALEMQGVKKFFPDGEASVQSLIAGNDMLCLPGDVPLAIEKIKKAIKKKALSWDDIEWHCKKVLQAKYEYGLAKRQPITITNITADLNKGIPEMRRLIAENAITLLAKSNEDFFPFTPWHYNQPNDVAYVAVGINSQNAFAQRMQTDYHAAVYYFDNTKKEWEANNLVKELARYKKIIVGIHNLGRSPASNYGLNAAELALVNGLKENEQAMLFVFGNAYSVKNFCTAKNLAVCYDDDPVTQAVAMDILQGKLLFTGVLPVTVCDNFIFGFGLKTASLYEPAANSLSPTPGFDPQKMLEIDSIANDAVLKRAAPGCRVMVVKNGRIAYNKAFGFYDYSNTLPVNLETVYDMASVTKICATTISVMRLYDEGKIELNRKLGDYLPLVRGTDKENLLIEDILLHQAGLVAYIPFYKETLDSTGVPLQNIYFSSWRENFPIRVAEHLYMRADWRDTMNKRILESKLGPAGKYIYSDNDFIFLGKVVEAISGMPLEKFVQETFYRPMALTSIGFRPRLRMPLDRIAPTEDEKNFRRQVIRGDVHDPGAAMFGGVAGHAGLFSDAYDLAAIMQMLLNGGTFNGKKYLNKETIDLFTGYHSNISRRGYGFDKPEKDNDKREEPYPSAFASPKTFGHTGFTGTCVWADPEENIIFIFLSNRVNPTVSPILSKMNVRSKIQDAIYKAILK